MRMNRIGAVAAAATIAATILAQPAFAGFVGSPGPVAGIGLPALAIIGGAYWLGRKLLGSRKQ